MTTTLQAVLRVPRSDVKLLADHAEGICRGDTLELHYTLGRSSRPEGPGDAGVVRLVLRPRG